MCQVCGFTKEEVSEQGIPRLLHNLQVPKGTDFWTLLAAEKHNIPSEDVSPEERQDLKVAIMSVLANVPSEVRIAQAAADRILQDIGYWAPEIQKERLTEFIVGAMWAWRNEIRRHVDPR